MIASSTRRRLLKIATVALATIPLATITRDATASTNPAKRAQLQYQDGPKGDMNGSNCLEFVPGKTAKDFGQCKQIPGDDEISPDGYCSLWNTM